MGPATKGAPDKILLANSVLGRRLKARLTKHDHPKGTRPAGTNALAGTFSPHSGNRQQYLIKHDVALRRQNAFVREGGRRVLSGAVSTAGRSGRKSGRQRATFKHLIRTVEGREMTSRFLILGGMFAFASVLTASVASGHGQDSAIDSAALFQTTVGPLIRQHCS